MSIYDDPKMDGYVPLDAFRVQDYDKSSRARSKPPSSVKQSIVVFPEELDFGEVQGDTTSHPQTVIITNNGKQPVTIPEITVVGPFTVSATSVASLAPGEHAMVQVRFAPVSNGPVTGAVYINAGEVAGTEFVKLFGVGVAEELPNPDLLGDFIREIGDERYAAKDKILTRPHRSAVASETVPSSVTHLYLAGYAEPGDGGGALYKRVSGPVTIRPWHFTSAGGIIWGLAEDTPDVRMFGAVGDSNGTAGHGNDDTSAWQAGIDYCALYGYELQVSAGTYRVTAPLVSTRAVRIRGCGVEAMAGNPVLISPRGKGAWVYFDHSGLGFQLGTNAGFASGAGLIGLGFCRNQPTPVSGQPFTPFDHDFDVHLTNTDIFIDQVMFFNSSRAIKLHLGSAGRLRIGTIMGQPLKVGVEIVESYDTTSFDLIHFWPMWCNMQEVLDYTNANASALVTSRCDGIQGNNLFALAYYVVHLVRGTPIGTTLRTHISNMYVDFCTHGLYIENSVGTGGTGSPEGAILTYSNIIQNGPTKESNPSRGVVINGNGSDVTITNLEHVSSLHQAILVTGTNNNLHITGRLFLRYWSIGANSGFPAVEATTGNNIRIDGYPVIAPGGGVGPKYGGSGRVFVDEWRDYAPTVEATVGTIAALGAVVGRYKLYHDTVHFEIDVTITDNGTGSGGVRITLPEFIGAFTLASGKEIAATGKHLIGHLPPNVKYLEIYQEGNLYPGANNARIIMTGSYKIA